MRRFVAACAVVTIASFGVGAGVSAYPIADDIAVSDNTPAPGGTFTVTMTGCLLGETVQFTVEGDSDTDTCTAGGGGTARGIAGPATTSASVVLTAPTTPGSYTVTAVGLTSGVTETSTIAVAPAGAAPVAVAGSRTAQAGNGALPATGSDGSVPIAQIGAGLLLAGLGLSAVVYRRRSLATA